MARLFLNLSISKQEMLKMYKGKASTVRATDSTGQKIQFPANALRPFITKDGVHGRFVIEHHNGKLISLNRISD